MLFLLIAPTILGAINFKGNKMYVNVYPNLSVKSTLSSNSDTKPVRSWTIMVYLDADNDLEFEGVNDFLEMSQVGSTNSVAIVVLFDRWAGSEGYDDTSYGDWTDTKLFYVTKNLKPYAYNALENWGEKNMGDPQTLIDFINYTSRNYPAKHYALVLWDHGGGYYGCCWDDDSAGDNLDLSEIRYALRYAYENLHIKIDLVGFDACLMGNIEVAYELRDYTDIVVFSQEYEPGDGWPYNGILGSLIENPNMSPADLAITIVNSYIDFYQDPYSGDQNATMSAINVSYLELYTFAAINRVAGYLLRYYDQFSSAISYAMDNAETFYYSWQKDITHFFMLLRDEVSDSYLKTLLDEAIDKLNNSIIAYGHLAFHPNAFGLSAYIYDAYFSLYYTLDSSQEHQWDELQKMIAGSDPGIWIYDAKLYGSDVDGDSIYDTNIKLWLDLDAESNVNVNVDVYGYNGYVEWKVGSTTCDIYGSAPTDAVNISLSIWNNATYTFRIVIWNDDIYKEFSYYFDEDVSLIPLETNNPIDTEPPEITILSPNNDTYTNGSGLLITWECSDNKGVDHIEIRIDDGSWINIGNVTSFEVPSLWEGSHIIYIRAVDVYGNTKTVSIRIIVDTTPPEITILEPINGTIINSTTVVLSWTTNDPDIDYFKIIANGSTIADKLTEDSHTISLTNDGFYIIKVVGVDKAGNTGSSTVRITIDTTPPEIKILNPQNHSTLSNKTFTLELEIKDNLEVEKVVIYINNKKYLEVSENYSQITIKTQSYGEHKIQIIAYDTAGNKASTVLVVNIGGINTTILIIALTAVLIVIVAIIILKQRSSKTQ